jgi:hypothetical protein
MLPGLRFLCAAAVLSMSLLVFGLGATALLRSARQDVANLPVMRAPPETVFAQPESQARLAMLRVEPRDVDADTTSALPAAALPPIDPTPQAEPTLTETDRTVTPGPLPEMVPAPVAIAEAPEPPTRASAPPEAAKPEAPAPALPEAAKPEVPASAEIAKLDMPAVTPAPFPTPAVVDTTAPAVAPAQIIVAAVADPVPPAIQPSTAIAPDPVAATAASTVVAPVVATKPAAAAPKPNPTPKLKKVVRKRVINKKRVAPRPAPVEAPQPANPFAPQPFR